MTVPFRWNITKREQLGTLPPLDREVPERFVHELRRATARIIAFCDDADMIFVGRSLETVFDYLSGLLRGISWEERLSLLNISLHCFSAAQIRSNYPQSIGPFQKQLDSLKLRPAELIQRPRPVAFIDIVDSGGTFGVLVELLLEWAKEQKVDESSVKKKVRFVGLTQKKKTSPNTWGWQQQNEWTRQFSTTAIKNVSVDFEAFWSGYEEPWSDRVATSNPPWRWGDASLEIPQRESPNLRALQLALFLYELGASESEKRAFTKQLTAEPGMRHRWYRGLVSELRGCG